MVQVEHAPPALPRRRAPHRSRRLRQTFSCASPLLAWFRLRKPGWVVGGRCDITLDDHLVLGHVREERVGHVAVRDHVIQVHGHRRIFERQMVVDRNERHLPATFRPLRRAHSCWRRRRRNARVGHAAAQAGRSRKHGSAAHEKRPSYSLNADAHYNLRLTPPRGASTTFTMNRMRPMPRSRSLARHAGILLLIGLGVAIGATRPDLAIPGETLAALEGQGIVARLEATPASHYGLLAPQTTSTAVAAERYDPAHDLGPLFHDVQMAAIFADSKTFADASARQAPDLIVARYAALRGRRDFDLKAFVAEHFKAPAAPGTDVHEASPRMEDHIRALWRPLTRPPDSQDPWSTLIPLPNAYVVPGGRFRAVYYWDAYFTMLGLI